MRRVIAAIVLLCIITGVAVLTNSWFKQTVIGYHDKLDTLCTLARGKHYPAAQQLAKVIVAQYREDERIFSLFAKKDTLYTINASVTGLPAYCNEETKYDLLCEASRSATLFDALLNSFCL